MVTNIRATLEYILGEEEAPKFAEWAFGKNFKLIEINGIEGMDCWNLIHGEKIKLKGDDLISESLNKMIELYKEEHEHDSP